MARAKMVGGSLVVLFLFCGCDNKAEFKEFKCEGGRFTVQMPGTPKEQKLEAAGIPLKTYSVDQWGSSYAVAYADIPDSFGRIGNRLDAMLDGAENGMIKEVNGKLLRSSSIQLANRYPGREVKAELPNKGIVLARIYVVGRRLYQVIVTGTKEWVTSPDATKFLDSLTLIP